MGFLKKYYEKIILAVFLLFFIIAIVFLIMALGKSQEITEKDLEFPDKKPDYRKLPELADIQKNFESESRWAKVVARTEGDKDFTDMLAPYKIARCPNPECQKLIPRSAFVAKGICPIPNCGFALKDLSMDMAQDSDDDGIPDKVEKANGLDPSDPTDASKDLDNDGFSNFDEFRATPSTNMNDPASHPPYAKRLCVKSMEFKLLPLTVSNVSKGSLPDKSDWAAEIAFGPDYLKRSSAKRKKMNFVIPDMNGKSYKIVDMTKDPRQKDAAKDNTNLGGTGTITIQAEGDDPIIATVKKPVYENKLSVIIMDPFNGKEMPGNIGDTFAFGDDRTGVEKYTTTSADIEKKTVIIKEIREDGTGLEFDLGMFEDNKGEDEVNKPAVENPVINNPPTGKMPPVKVLPSGMPPGIKPGVKPPGGMPL